MSRLRQHTISFKHAFDGLLYTLKTQPNFQVHVVFALIAISLGFVLKITNSEWAVILFVIGLVLVSEMVNTSIESVVDLLTDKYHLSAKIAKDVSAGMVLVTAGIAVITGALIFVPHIISLVCVLKC